MHSKTLIELLALASLCLLVGCPSVEPAVDDDDATEAVDDDDGTTSDDDDDATPAGWRSALYPVEWELGFGDADGRFLHDFSWAGYHNGEAVPPDLPAVVDVTEHGADPTGATDSTEAIQAAVDAATEGGAVLLPAGTYRVDGLLVVQTDGLVLRGEGADQTFVVFTRGDSMTDVDNLTLRGAVTRGDDLALAVDGYALGVTVELVDASSLQVGDEVAVGWVITDDFIADHGMTGTWQAFNGQWQPFFHRTVVTIEDNLVWLDIPLRYGALLRDSASLRVETGYLVEAGVEDLAVSTVVAHELAWSNDRSHAISLSGCADCWVRRVASFEPDEAAEAGFHLQSGGIEVADSKRVTVSDSELGYAQNRGGGGNGYLFEVARSGEVLVRDSVGVWGRHNFIQNWGFGTSGCVWLRTVSQEGLAALDEDGDFGTPGLSEYHHSLAMANLVDDSLADDGWGAVNRHDWSSGAGHTATQNLFWNVRGAGVVRSFQHGWGYVIGTDGPTVEADIANDGLFSPGEGTEPDDYLEGLDEGATLQPVSLYEDQLSRRLAR